MSEGEGAAAGGGKAVDKYGFERNEHYDEKAKAAEKQYESGMEQRKGRFEKLFKGKAGAGEEKALDKTATLKRYCRKGIPDDLRAQVWMDVSGATELMKNAEAGLYTKLKETPLTNPKVEEQINKDLHRTFPENVHFHGDFDEEKNAHAQSSKIKEMSNVLRADSNHNPRGYCQGLNYVVGMLLLVLENEERAFWCLQALTTRLLPEYYSVDMFAMRVEQNVLNELVKARFPKLHTHLESGCVSIQLLATKWFVCLYIDSFPTETVLRVWDSLFFEGSKIIFRVALAMFKKNQKPLLAMKLDDPGEIYQACKDMSQKEVDCHGLMDRAFDIKGLAMKQITVLREQQAATLKQQDGK